MNNIVNLAINASRIKYDVLDDILADVKIRPHMVNIFIDLYSVIYRLFSDNIIDHIHNSEKKKSTIVINIVISVINTVAHYRNYFSSIGKDNRVFLLFSRSAPSFQTHYMPSYGEKYYVKFSPNNVKFSEINEMVWKAVEFIKDAFQYIEDIFYIDCDGVEEFSAIKYIMDCNEAIKDFNVIISKNELMMELISERAVIIYPKRDDSYVITKDNWASTVVKGTSYKPKTWISPIYIPIYLAIKGVKSRKTSTSYRKGTVSTMKLIAEVSRKFNLRETSMYTFLSALEDTIPPSRFPSKSQSDELIMFHHIITLNNTLNAMFSYQRESILSQIYNIFDRDALEKINEMLSTEFDDIIELNLLERSFGYRTRTPKKRRNS